MSGKWSTRLVGRSGMAYALTEPLYPRFSNGLNPHVWKATSLTGNNVVVKLRRDAAQSAAEFQKEVSQCQRFKGAAHIRQLLDVIKDETPSKDFDRGMVLEWLPETLWDVRENGRLTKFGLAGIRKIMRDALEGIEELHAEGVIHLDIKAQNILLNGTSAKLFDLGSTWAASPPSTGVAQPMPYRSPEILFGLRWSKEVDIWGWAMVYLHMIQAYLRPDIWGLYDRLPDESTADTTQIYEERVRVDVFHDFKLYNIPFFEQCKDSWPELDPEREEVTIRSILEYLQFPEEDIHLLERVMVPEPKARPTAKDILRQGWIITRE
ncbi:mitogen-activated protein kinase kinase kinase [Microsporum canis]